MSTGYWAAFGYSFLTALISAIIVSYLNNAATILPQDPTSSPDAA